MKLFLGLVLTEDSGSRRWGLEDSDCGEHGKPATGR